MHRNFRQAFGMLIILTLTAGEARAQYYGLWGWGGAGSTVQGSTAQGLGYFNMGTGLYNEATAVAAAIDADTIMRWNQFMFSAQQEANRREYLRRERLMHRDAQTGDATYKRVRDNPTDRDIQDGDALNAILDQLTDPRIHSTALRLIKTPIPAKAIREIPFKNASEAVTLSLDELIGEGYWPPALSRETFAIVRKAYKDAINQAVKEDENGTLSEQTLQEVNLATSRLRAKLEENRPADKAAYNEALTYIKGLIGMARMLEKPEVDKILAELDTVRETALGSMLSFMHAYNLRFGPPTLIAQRVVYENLYPHMAEARDLVLKEADPGANGSALPARDSRRRPTDFFQGMHLERRSGSVQNRP